MSETSIILRIVRIFGAKVKPKEYFMKFISVDSTTGKTYPKEHCILLRLDSTFSKGQGSDTGLNIEGCNSGEQSTFLQIYRRAFLHPVHDTFTGFIVIASTLFCIRNIVKCTIFWGITTCIPLNFNRCFRGIYSLHL
jgi:hypothetical protein